MGAHNIEFKLPKSSYPTEESVRNWYRSAVEQAHFEDGHDPYNGTISTTRGIRFSERSFKKYEDASEYVLDNTEKWGYVLAVTLEENGKTYWIIGGWAAS